MPVPVQVLVPVLVQRRQLPVQVRVRVLVPVPVLVQVLVQRQPHAAPQWHRHSPQRRWQASSWHHASKVLAYRFSRPSQRQHCASCQQFERLRR